MTNEGGVQRFAAVSRHREPVSGGTYRDQAMTDETDDEEILCELEDDESVSDWVIYSGAGSTNSGQIIFPYGVAHFCEQAGASAIRIADKTGEIEVLTENNKWVTVGKGKSNTSVVEIHGKTDK
jgi:hypothetical protein